MTNFGEWDKKAKALEKEAEEEEKREKEENDKALGLQDGPQGPATAKAKSARKEMSEHSVNRRNFIAEQQAKEINLTHTSSDEVIVLTETEHGGRAVRLQGCEHVAYEIPAGVQLIKFFVDNCKNVTVVVKHPLTTSNIEVCRSSDVTIKAYCAISTVQCDECTEGPVRFWFNDEQHVGNLIHQNSPALQVQVEGAEFVEGRDYVDLGLAGRSQYIARCSAGIGWINEPIVRGEGDFPVNAMGDASQRPAAQGHEPEAEAAPAPEERRQRAEAKRAEGNAAFKANDFLQAAVFYTEAINIDPDLHISYANRAQCFLHTAQPEKALEDSIRCTEMAPEYAKGWFRKGMSLHALKRYGEAIPALGEAEKLDPKNSQIPDAIKMAQLMCRKHGPNGDL